MVETVGLAESQERSPSTPDPLDPLTRERYNVWQPKNSELAVTGPLPATVGGYGAGSHCWVDLWGITFNLTDSLNPESNSGVIL